MDCIYNCTAQAAGIDWPAWVQAVGSVVGLGIAIAIPLTASSRDRKQRESDATAKARTYALHLMPHATKLRNKLRTAQILVSDSDEDQLPQIIEVLEEASGLDVWGLQIHELGSAGEPLQRSIAAAIEALKNAREMEFHRSFSGQIINQETGEVSEFDPPPLIGPQVGVALKLADEAIAALESLFT